MFTITLETRRTLDGNEENYCFAEMAKNILFSSGPLDYPEAMDEIDKFVQNLAKRGIRKVQFNDVYFWASSTPDIKIYIWDLSDIV